MNIFMFAGQGSQYYGMGKELYKNNEIFKGWMDRLDELFQDRFKSSVVKELYKKDRKLGEPLDNLLISHPAIFMVEFSLARMLMADGVSPDILIASSLGEYIALALSKVIHYESLFDIICMQAKYIEESCPNAKMIAILNNYESIEFPEDFKDSFTVASYTNDNHFVLTLKEDILKDIVEYLDKKNIIYQVLPIRYGFHSKYVNEAESEFMEFIKDVEFRSPDFPIYSCCQGGLIDNFDSKYLWNIVRREILFNQTSKKLEKDVLAKHSTKDVKLIDISPGGTMAALVRACGTSFSNIFPIMTPYNVEIKNIQKFEQFSCK